MNRINEKKRKERIEQIRRKKENMTCANCNARRPTDVCITFNTFVCQQCAGVHREFSHRIKGISASTFSLNEVEALASGGNRLDAELYLAKWNKEEFPKPERGDVRRIKQFIRSKYVDKMWYSERRRRRRTKDHEESPSLSRKDRAGSLKNAPASSVRRRRRRAEPAASPSATSETKNDSNGGFEFLSGFNEPAKASPQPSPQPEPAKQGGTDDWADFDAAPSPSAPRVQEQKSPAPGDWMSVFSQGETTQRTTHEQQRKQEQFHNVFGSDPFPGTSAVQPPTQPAQSFDVFGNMQQQVPVNAGSSGAVDVFGMPVAQAQPQASGSGGFDLGQVGGHPGQGGHPGGHVGQGGQDDNPFTVPQQQPVATPTKPVVKETQPADPFAGLLSGTDLVGNQTDRQQEQQARDARRDARIRRSQGSVSGSSGSDNPFASPMQQPMRVPVVAPMSNPGGMPGAMPGAMPGGMPGMNMAQMTPQMMAQMQQHMQAQMMQMQAQMQALSMMQARPGQQQQGMSMQHTPQMTPQMTPQQMTPQQQRTQPPQRQGSFSDNPFM